MHEEISEITIVLNRLVVMINLYSWVIDELLLLWVELSGKEWIVVSLHRRNEDLPFIVIAQ